MKGTRNFLLGAILGTIMGWALGYLRLPMLGKNNSFLIGFSACLALVLFIIIGLFLWNKNAFLLRLIGKGSSAGSPEVAAKTYTIIGLTIATFIAFGGFSSSFMTYQQNQFLKTQAENQTKRIQEQSALIESVRKSNLIFLMSNLLSNIDEELKTNSNGELSDAIIARIAVLAHSFKPYRYFDGERLSSQKWSPERGQLLLALSLRKIDSTSFAKIKRSTSFAKADLNGAVLIKADLTGINLTGANLKDTDLTGTNFAGANLKEANLWGSILNQTNFDSASMQKAVLAWAELNDATLKSANLTGADLTNSKLKNSDLTKATFQWAKLDGALFNETNLTGCNLLGASLIKVNFTKTNLSKSLLERANFSEAILLESLFKNANVEKNWLEKLEAWQTSGTKEILERYQITTDTSGKHKNAKFQLEIK